MSENYIVINGKKADLTEEQLEKLGIKAKENKRWRAKDGETYWLAVPSMRLNRYVVDSDQGIDDGVTYVRYYTHNYFRTKEEAQKYVDVLNTEMELMKYADEHNGELDWDNIYQRKYSLGYQVDVGKARAVTSDLIRDGRIVYFSSEELARQAIEVIGEDNVIEYLTYEW